MTAPKDARSEHLVRNIAVLALGNFACATSVLFIKGSTTHPILLSCYRLIVAVLLLLPLFLRAWSLHRATFPRGELLKTVLPGILLGLHFISWIMGARMTPAVNSSAIVNFGPLITPGLLFLITKEKLNASEWRGSAVALAGVALLVGRDLTLSHEYFLGDVTCFVSMLVSASYLVLARKNRHFPSIWLYIVPMYAVAAVFCFLASFAFEPPSAKNFTLHEMAMVACLGLVPTVMGHSALNHAMRHFRGQVVSLSSLSQPFFAGVMAFLLLGEVPDWFFYPACVLIAAGAGIALRGGMPPKLRALDPAEH